MLTASTQSDACARIFAPLETEKTSRRKLRDTKIGQWLKSSAPNVLDAVGDALPDSGVLGIVKNLVDLENTVTHEQRMELQNLIVFVDGLGHVVKLCFDPCQCCDDLVQLVHFAVNLAMVVLLRVDAVKFI